MRYYMLLSDVSMITDFLKMELITLKYLFTVF